jgi:hypothetical protein
MYYMDNVAVNAPIHYVGRVGYDRDGYGLIRGLSMINDK